MFGSQFSESNTRKISMPCAADSWMNSCTTLSGIGGVSDRVRGAQQHLEADIRDRFPQDLQPLERILLEEAHAPRRMSRRPTSPGCTDSSSR